MKAGWATMPLSDLTSKIGSGATPTGGENSYAKEGIALIRSLNVHDSGFRLKDLARISGEQAKKLDNVAVTTGDVLLNITGASIARCAVVPDDILPARVNQHVSILRPIGSKLLPTFLNYLLISPVYKDRLLSAGEAGSTRQALTKAQLEDFRVAIPPLPEQQRIVSILDDAFEGITTTKENTERNLQNARNLFESQRERRLTETTPNWRSSPIDSLCEIKHGFAFKGENFAKEGEYVLLTPGNFYETGGYRDRGDKQKYYRGAIPAGYLLQAGDMLVAMTEQAAGLLGSSILIPESGKFLHNQRLGLVQSKPGVPWSNRFFFHVFNLRAIRSDIQASATGVKVRHTSPTKIGNISVTFPPSVSEQERIARNIDLLQIETDHLESIYHQKLVALNDLKKSILDQAFSGNL